MTDTEGLTSVLGGLRAAVRRIEAEQLKQADRLARLVREMKGKGLLSEEDANRLLDGDEHEPS